MAGRAALIRLLSPLASTRASSTEAYESYRVFKLLSAMPVPGGTDDQDAEWVEQIEVLQAVVNELEHERQEADRARQREQARARNLKKGKGSLRPLS